MRKYLGAKCMNCLLCSCRCCCSITTTMMEPSITVSVVSYSLFDLFGIFGCAGLWSVNHEPQRGRQ